VALPAAPSATPCRLHGVRILVVDDDGDSRDLLAAMLVEVGAAVRTCSSAIAALDIVQEWRPDVLVSDIEMPEEVGYTLIRKVRALDADHGGKIPAVALTAYGRIQDRSVSLTAGYNIHVPKPADPAELTALIAGLAAPPVDATRTPTH